MNHPMERDRQIERLIDGELNQDEQQHLLETLDRDPNTWRSVALGFVESQLIQSELIALRPEPMPEPATAPANSTAPPRRNTLSRVMTIVAAAAAAFSIGIVARHWWPEPAPPDPNSLVGSPRTPVRNTPAVQLKPVPRSNDSLRTVRIPILPADHNVARMVDGQPTLTPELAADLQRSGHMVSEERRYYRVTLDDGREVMIPVREIQVEFRGEKVIQ